MIVAERLAQLDTLRLDKGAHRSFEDGHCALEVVAWLAGKPHGDHPECVSPILGAFLRQWNDDLDHDGRQRLKPFLSRVLGTAGDGQDEARGWLCADWLVRTYTPAWLALAGITESAEALRSLPPLRDLASVKAARPAIDESREKARAARDAARDAAWDAARDAARAAARAAARDAAWAAARDAARDAAWAAAWDAARAAARDAARAALRPTTESLQDSALALLDRLIDPSADPS